MWSFRVVNLLEARRAAHLGTCTVRIRVARQPALVHARARSAIRDPGRAAGDRLSRTLRWLRRKRSARRAIVRPLPAGRPAVTRSDSAHAAAHDTFTLSRGRPPARAATVLSPSRSRGRHSARRVVLAPATPADLAARVYAVAEGFGDPVRFWM